MKATAVMLALALAGIPRSAIDPPMAQRIAAASNLESLLARSRYSSWGLRARAASPDCSILLVRTRSIILEDTLAGGLYWGSPFMVGGLRMRSAGGGFRAVVVADSTGKLWGWGSIEEGELQSLLPCQ